MEKMKGTENSFLLTAGQEGNEARQVHPDPELFILSLQIFDNDILSSDEDCYKSIHRPCIDANQSQLDVDRK